MKNKRTTELNNIAEVTQQYNTTVKKSTITNEEKDEIQDASNSNQVTCFDRLINSLKKCLEMFTKDTKQTEFIVNESEMTKEVQRIKNYKTKYISVLPEPKQKDSKTLVIDLDQTLIHTSFKKTKYYDYLIEVQVKGQPEMAYVTKRFGLDNLLFEMSQIYEIIVFTAGQKQYTDQVLSLIDPKKRISHVLYRQSCTILNKSYFLKNLNILGRNLNKTILIDDNNMAGILHPQIFYNIEPFYGNYKDRKLIRLVEFLKQMAKEQDFSCLNQKRKLFEAKRNIRKLNHITQEEKRMNQFGEYRRQIFSTKNKDISAKGAETTTVQMLQHQQL